MIVKTDFRKPAVAGSFYPADKNLLQQELSTYLNRTRFVFNSKKIKVLIVPHAGTVYSGQTAAWGYKQLSEKQYAGIILLGVSHTSWFNHAAIWPNGGWQTPIGLSFVDKKACLSLLNPKQKIIIDRLPHLSEHTLELQLIFVQQLFPSTKIVPILISHPEPTLIDTLASKICQLIKANYILIVSSDLSHYPHYSTAQLVDNQTINAIISGQLSNFETQVKQIEAENFPGLETAACGYHAIRTALLVGEKLHLNWKKIFYQNSGDISGDLTQVVGYCSLIGLYITYDYNKHH